MVVGKCVEDAGNATGNTTPVVPGRLHQQPGADLDRPGDGTIRINGKCLDTPWTVT
jgi:hypothetical protein